MASHTSLRFAIVWDDVRAEADRAVRGTWARITAVATAILAAPDLDLTGEEAHAAACAPTPST
jgi:hypothetical protein